MSEKRYGYCDDIAAIVDMSKLTIEGGEEMTTNDVVERLNQLEEESATIKREKQEWKSIAEQAMNIVTSWQIDWDEMTNNPEYKPEFSKDTKVLLGRMALLTGGEDENE